jgi:hypothetical protein
MAEARNLISLQTQATPLAGGENAPLGDSDFAGVAPRAKVAATPNALMTPLRAGAGQVGLTPRGTPLRDELGLNAGGVAQRAEQAALRARLTQGLSTLPKPRYDRCSPSRRTVGLMRGRVGAATSMR